MITKTLCELKKSVVLFVIGSALGLVFILARRMLPNISEDRLAGTIVLSALWLYVFSRIAGIVYTNLAAPEFAEQYNRVFAAYKESILHVVALATALSLEGAVGLASFAAVRFIRPGIFHSLFPIATVSILGALSLGVAAATIGYLLVSYEKLGPTVRKNIIDLSLRAYRQVAEQVLSMSLISPRQ